MRRESRWPWIEALVGCFVPRSTSEAMIGDLMEESAIRSASGSPRDVSRWCWRQVLGSVHPLLWATLKTKASLVTLSVALLAYVVASGVEVATTTVISAVLSPPSGLQTGLDLIVGLTAIGLAAYFATIFRRGSAAVLAAIVIVVVASLMATMPDSAPIWYAVGFLTMGPLAAIAGGTLGAMQQDKRRRTEKC